MYAVLTLKERIEYIQTSLDDCFPNPQVPLDHKDPFTLLVAVLLSAQCTDERVNKVTPKLFNLASTSAAMSKLSQDKIYSIIKPCGLGPQKSRAIKELSCILMDRFNGKVPKDIKALEQLPGVGHKTASVVMSQAFGEPAFPVDTHIHRLAQRWKLTNGKSVVQTEKDLKKHFPPKAWNRLHLQIIFWGRTYCQATKCFALECKICSGINPHRKRPFRHKRP
ncbi:MAG: endonuclease III [Gammaproteobacteria bacterium]